MFQTLRVNDVFISLTFRLVQNIRKSKEMNAFALFEPTLLSMASNYSTVYSHFLFFFFRFFFCVSRNNIFRTFYQARFAWTSKTIVNHPDENAVQTKLYTMLQTWTFFTQCVYKKKEWTEESFPLRLCLNKKAFVGMNVECWTNKNWCLLDRRSICIVEEKKYLISNKNEYFLLLQH